MRNPRSFSRTSRLADGLVHLLQGEELALAQGGHDPALDHLDAHFRLGRPEKFLDPPAVFVYQTCVPAMIGDDINAVCKAAAEIRQAGHSRQFARVRRPKNLGNKLAGEAMLDHVIGTEEPDYTTPYDLNIIGEYNLAGELWQVKPLLDELGIRILSCISGDGKYREVAYSHRAKRGDDGLLQGDDQCRAQMEERYGIPFFEGSFYGIEDIQRFAAGNRPAADRARRARRTDGRAPKR